MVWLQLLHQFTWWDYQDDIRWLYLQFPVLPTHTHTCSIHTATTVWQWFYLFFWRASNNAAISFSGVCSWLCPSTLKTGETGTKDTCGLRNEKPAVKHLDVVMEFGGVSGTCTANQSTTSMLDWWWSCPNPCLGITETPEVLGLRSPSEIKGRQQPQRWWRQAETSAGPQRVRAGSMTRLLWSLCAGVKPDLVRVRG